VTLIKDIFTIEAIKDDALCNVRDSVEFIQLLIRINLNYILIEKRNNFLVLELYCLFVATLSKEVVILRYFQLYLIIRSVLLKLQKELIQFFFAVVVLILNVHTRARKT
jgi:hypothetical protein